MTAQAAKKVSELEIEANGVERGTVADGLLSLATAARAQNRWLRVFDIRYATAGIPCEITPHYVMFPPGSTEVLETGNLNEPAVSFEVLQNPKMVMVQAIIHAEVCEINKGKGKSGS